MAATEQQARCPQCGETEDCDDCVDFRYMPAVNDYASTCDGCAELTMHELMWMDEETQLGYCEKCTPIYKQQEQAQ